MLPGHKYTPEEIARIVLRRSWLIMLPLAAGLAATPMIANRLPELYRSETLIMVVPQRVPDEYVKSTITSKIEDRLPSISEQILSRSRLERIITEFDLYRRERARLVMEDVVQRMRTDIGVDLEKSGDSFRVSYVNDVPKTAQKVTERLATFYIEENLRDRENQAESTSVFLEAQLEDAKRRLVEHEKKLEDYRRRHAGQLPSQLQGNLQAIQSAQLQLQAVNEAMNRARERRLLVERQLADAHVLPLNLVQPGLRLGPDEAGEGGAAPMTPAQQLEAAQTRLDALKLRYKADHPDIRALERSVLDLQARVEEEKTAESGGEKPASEAEMARQKRIGELEAELEMIDRQIAAGQADQARLTEATAGYQAKIDVLPTRESELVELTRDYVTLQATYASLLAKREDSKLAANLERRQIGEQFKILDPASLPERPYNQLQRIGLAASGAVLGLLLGLGMIALPEYRDSSLKTEADAARLLNLPVLALVPDMVSKAEERRLRLRGWLVNGAAAAALLVSVAALILWRLRL